MMEYNTSLSIEAQNNFCEKNRLPNFAPQNGRCWGCGKNIYEEKNGMGITVEQASQIYITGCPFCNRSFCD